METYYIYQDHITREYFLSLEDLDALPVESRWDHPLFCESCGDYDFLITSLRADHEPSAEEIAQAVASARRT